MKKALVLGGTSGLGLELAKLMAQAGIMPYVVGTTAKNPKYDLTGMVGVEADLADPDVDEQIINTLGRLDDFDYLVIAGGVWLSGRIVEHTKAEIRHLNRVNYEGPIEVIRAFHTKKRGAYHLISITSTTAIDVRKTETVYGAAQAARRMFALDFSYEMLTTNTESKVLVVCPGGMQTPMWNGSKVDISGFMNPAAIAKIIWDRATAQVATMLELVIRRNDKGEPQVHEIDHRLG